LGTADRCPQLPPQSHNHARIRRGDRSDVDSRRRTTCTPVPPRDSAVVVPTDPPRAVRPIAHPERCTRSHNRAVLSAAVKWAVKKRWGSANAVWYSDPPVAARRAMVTRHLDASEFALSRERLAGDRLECAYLLCCYLGLRRGEVLGLVWPDI